jgi:hypothetical protein
MVYERALVTVSHSFSHNADATTIPLLPDIFQTRNPEVSSEDKPCSWLDISTEMDLRTAEKNYRHRS